MFTGLPMSATKISFEQNDNCSYHFSVTMQLIIIPYFLWYLRPSSYIKGIFMENWYQTKLFTGKLT